MKKLCCFVLAFITLCTSTYASNVNWLHNLNQFAGGNYNRLYDFENGYAVFVTGDMDKNWQTSNMKTGIIDKSGNIVYGPVNGNLSIKILENNRFCIGSSTSTYILDMSGTKVVSFNGLLLDGGTFNSNQIACYTKKGYDGYSRFGLVRSNGTEIVPCQYWQRYYDNNDNSKFVLISSRDLKAADVYNADGSFSHYLSMNYQIADYKHQLIEIADESGYRGVADIYGNIILAPHYNKINFISENRIFASGDNSYLLDRKGTIIKEYGSYSSASESYKDRLIINDHATSYLSTLDGDVLKTYERTQYPHYVGDGIFQITCIPTSYHEEKYSCLIDGETGDFINGKYKYNSTVEFNEGYATVRDLDGNQFIIDKDGNKFCEEFSPTHSVSDGILIVYRDNDELNTPGLIYMPKYKKTNLIINNSTVNLLAKPQKSNNRTFYPFRECLEILGATVSWDNTNRVAKGEYKGITVEFPINSNKYYINGIEYKMDVVSYIDSDLGRTYIPIRYAAEALGFTVDWFSNDSESTISIHN